MPRFPYPGAEIATYDGAVPLGELAARAARLASCERSRSPSSRWKHMLKPLPVEKRGQWPSGYAFNRCILLARVFTGRV